MLPSPQTIDHGHSGHPPHHMKEGGSGSTTSIRQKNHTTMETSLKRRQLGKILYPGNISPEIGIFPRPCLVSTTSHSRWFLLFDRGYCQIPAIPSNVVGRVSPMTMINCLRDGSMPSLKASTGPLQDSPSWHWGRWIQWHRSLAELLPWRRRWGLLRASWVRSLGTCWWWPVRNCAPCWGCSANDDGSVSWVDLSLILLPRLSRSSSYEG